jgi:hypothetical protein
MSKPGMTEYSASSGESKWLRAMGMQPGEFLVQEVEEADGVLIVRASRIERDGVVIKTTVGALAQPPGENGDSLTDQHRSVRSDPVAP